MVAMQVAVVQVGPVLAEPVGLAMEAILVIGRVIQLMEEVRNMILEVGHVILVRLKDLKVKMVLLVAVVLLFFHGATMRTKQALGL